MPARDKSNFTFPDDESDNNIPNIFGEDDAIWMLLNTYADGEATQEEVAQAEVLLKSHPQAAREFAFLQLTSESVREFAEVEPPLSLSNAIFAATTRRKTWKQRVSAWWIQFGRSLAPAPLRLGLAGSAMAVGLLAVVLWPRHGAQPPVSQALVQHKTGPKITALAHTELAKNVTPKIKRIETHENISPPPIAPEIRKSDNTESIVKLDIPTPKPASLMNNKPITPEIKHLTIVKNDVKPDKPNKVKMDSPTANVVASARATHEERHMAVNTSDAASSSTGASSLGPDVDAAQPEEAHVVTADMTDMGMPPTHEDPPVKVQTVSYKPGSISETVHPAPPTLAMRANEAIKREHELQKYGGYGKEAYNNIQRGEVGFSLVGGRF